MKRDTVLNAKALKVPGRWSLCALPALGRVRSMYMGILEVGRGAGLVQNLRPWDRQCGCHIQSSVKHMSLGVWLYKRGWKCSII